MSTLPKHFVDFRGEHPDLAKAYEAFGSACHAAGPLDEKTRALVKLGIAIGSRQEGAVHAQVRKSAAVGLRPDELRHAAFLAMPTIGFPAAMAALSWIDDLAARRKKRATRKK
jgi:alkylhydroperoxidase/carboxymuconolactone decarboxylase family protein YurZ